MHSKTGLMEVYRFYEGSFLNKEEMYYAISNRNFGKFTDSIDEKLDAKFYYKIIDKRLNKLLEYSEHSRENGVFTGGYILQGGYVGDEVDKYTIHAQRYEFLGGDFTKKTYDINVVDDNVNNEALMVILKDREKAIELYGEKFLLREPRLLCPKKILEEQLKCGKENRQLNWGKAKTHWFIVDLSKPYNEILNGDFAPSYFGFELSPLLGYYIAYYQAVENGVLDILANELELEASDILDCDINEVNSLRFATIRLKVYGNPLCRNLKSYQAYKKYENDFCPKMEWKEYNLNQIPQDEIKYRVGQPEGNPLTDGGFLFMPYDKESREEYFKEAKKREAIRNMTWDELTQYTKEHEKEFEMENKIFFESFKNKNSIDEELMTMAEYEANPPRINNVETSRYYVDKGVF